MNKSLNIPLLHDNYKCCWLYKMLQQYDNKPLSSVRWKKYSGMIYIHSYPIVLKFKGYRIDGRKGYTLDNLRYREISIKCYCIKTAVHNTYDAALCELYILASNIKNLQMDFTNHSAMTLIGDELSMGYIDTDFVNAIKTFNAIVIYTFYETDLIYLHKLNITYTELRIISNHINRRTISDIKFINNNAETQYMLRNNVYIIEQKNIIVGKHTKSARNFIC